MIRAALKKVAAAAPGKPSTMVPGLGDGKGSGSGTLPRTLELASVIVERFKKLR